jgi:hypothetical protein
VVVHACHIVRLTVRAGVHARVCIPHRAEAKVAAADGTWSHENFAYGSTPVCTSCIAHVICDSRFPVCVCVEMGTVVIYVCLRTCVCAIVCACVQVPSVLAVAGHVETRAKSVPC